MITVEKVLEDALTLIQDETWTAPQITNGVRGWCIDDALNQGLYAQRVKDHVEVWVAAADRLTAAAGTLWGEWEREPGRTQDDVENLLKKAIGGE